MAVSAPWVRFGQAVACGTLAVALMGCGGSSGGAPPDGKKAVAVVPQDLGTLIVPGVADLPSGWSVGGTPKVSVNDDPCDGAICGFRYTVSTQLIGPGGTTGAKVKVAPMETSDGAKALYESRLGPVDWPATSLQPVGDMSAAFTSMDGSTLRTDLAVGTVFVEITYGGERGRPHPTYSKAWPAVSQSAHSNHRTVRSRVHASPLPSPGLARQTAPPSVGMSRVARLSCQRL